MHPFSVNNAELLYGAMKVLVVHYIKFTLSHSMSSTGMFSSVKYKLYVNNYGAMLYSCYLHKCVYNVGKLKPIWLRNTFVLCCC